MVALYFRRASREAIKRLAKKKKALRNAYYDKLNHITISSGLAIVLLRQVALIFFEAER